MQRNIWHHLNFKSVNLQKTLKVFKTISMCLLDEPTSFLNTVSAPAVQSPSVFMDQMYTSALLQRDLMSQAPLMLLIYVQMW